MVRRKSLSYVSKTTSHSTPLTSDSPAGHCTERLRNGEMVDMYGGHLCENLTPGSEEHPADLQGFHERR